MRRSDRQEDKKRNKKKKDVGCAFEIQILSVLKRNHHRNHQKKEMEGFTSSEDFKKKGSDECSDSDAKLIKPFLKGG